MLNGKRVVVVMPAFHAGRTLEATWRDLPRDVVDDIIVVDDASDDDTVAVARRLGLEVILHPSNLGYGANQKTCYREALRRGADIVVMVHPDYQYDPRLVTAMAGMIASGVYDIVIGSRILGGGALAGGMPLWKYVANRALTTFENVLLGAKLSEYHSGYRAYSRSLLDALPWQHNSDDFVFDNEILAQAIVGSFRIGEISVPTRYFPEASSIDFPRAVRYGFGVVGTALLAFLARSGLYRHRLFAAPPRAAEPSARADACRFAGCSAAPRGTAGCCTGSTRSRCTSRPVSSPSPRTTRRCTRSSRPGSPACPRARSASSPARSPALRYRIGTCSTPRAASRSRACGSSSRSLRSSRRTARCSRDCSAWV